MAGQTRVPLDVFARVSGAPAVPPALAHAVEGGTLRVFSNAELVYRLAGVTARAVARWDVSTTARRRRQLARGPARPRRHHLPGADPRRRASGGACSWKRAETPPPPRGRWPRRSRPRGPSSPASRRARAVTASTEVTVDAGPDGGHEAHFALLLAELLEWIDAGHRPAALAARTLAKYELLAAAAAATAADAAAGR